MNNPDSILLKIEKLIDGWCERRVLKPLSYILKSYPLSGGLTDEWASLLESLKDIKGLCQKDLSIEEKALLIETINEIHAIIYRP